MKSKIEMMKLEKPGIGVLPFADLAIRIHVRLTPTFIAFASTIHNVQPGIEFHDNSNTGIAHVFQLSKQILTWFRSACESRVFYEGAVNDLFTMYFELSRTIEHQNNNSGMKRAICFILSDNQ